ncbi:RNA recognition motif rrm domain containing protein [Anaeramoeba flamelloides]|uniref:RNA recognition motif rrm domain containing protein n=1 Tax=Anaeramoeba flamelloides TaxID=1746091 RepID=A0AAV7ZB64_9EUKA|nr:RNA recognition motif rrm domain containing protein [Anaeramoeba flamelloides]
MRSEANQSEPNWTFRTICRVVTCTEFLLSSRYLPYSVGEKELYRLFDQCGELSRVMVGYDRIARHSKGFVTFVRRDDAEYAFDKFHQRYFEGRRLRLDWDQGIQKKRYLPRQSSRKDYQPRRNNRKFSISPSRSPSLSPSRSPTRSPSSSPSHSPSPRRKSDYSESSSESLNKNKNTTISSTDQYNGEKYDETENSEQEGESKKKDTKNQIDDEKENEENEKWDKTEKDLIHNNNEIDNDTTIENTDIKVDQENQNANENC